MRTVTAACFVALAVAGCSSAAPKSADVPTVVFHGVAYPIPAGWAVSTTPVSCASSLPTTNTVVASDALALPSCAQFKVPPAYEQVTIRRWIRSAEPLPSTAKPVTWHGMHAYEDSGGSGPPFDSVLFLPTLKAQIRVEATSRNDAIQLIRAARPG